MKFKFLIGLIMAICLGFVISQAVIFTGKGALNLAYNSYRYASQINLRDIDISKFNLASVINLTKTETIENDVLQIIQIDSDGKEIFINPATKIFEDFPNNEPDNVNRHQISEDLTIPNEGKAVVANLSTMKIYLYEDGTKLESFDILSKGRPGTAWETPPGLFEIRHKTEKHFSSIGEVWMPYSMQFFGNYFIHGWPHYGDGTPVSEGYSGGCIRMSDENARIIYEFVEITTPVLVFGTTVEKISESQKGYYVVENLSNYPSLKSQIYIVADMESGDILFSKDFKKIIPIASVTKLMTALISLETINQYLYTTVSQSAYDTEGWRGNLSVGEKILTGDLMFPLLLQSSNDASEVLAEFSGRANFIRNMNIRAKSLDLINTSFSDPSGLSENNISTAEDLLKLVNYIYRYKRYIFDVTKLEKYVNENHTWPNTSRFAGEDYFLGGKNGFTDEARHTLITLVNLPIKTEKHGSISVTDNLAINETTHVTVKPEIQKVNRKFAIILLQSHETVTDTKKLIDYLKSSVKYVSVD